MGIPEVALRTVPSRNLHAKKIRRSRGPKSLDVGLRPAKGRARARPAFPLLPYFLTWRNFAFWLVASRCSFVSFEIACIYRDGTDLRRGSSQKNYLFFFGGGFRLLVFSGCQHHLPPPATRPLPSTSFQTTLPDQPPDHPFSSLQTISHAPPPDHLP